MGYKDNSNNEQDVSIVHLNPREELTDFEKTAILQFRFDELSKTQEFKLLNKKYNNIEEVNLPKKKQSLYDTLSIAIDKIIKRKNKKYTRVKSIDKVIIGKKKSKIVNFNNEVSKKQLSELCNEALELLSMFEVRVRKHSNVSDKKVKNVHINQTKYNQKYKELNDYAINKLYNQVALRETKSYKLYRILLFLICLFILISICFLGNWYYEGIRTEKLNNKIKEQIIVKDTSDDVFIYSMNFDVILKENSDTVGWIKVNNTNIDYPVVQNIDNDYYLTRSFDKTRNNAGWIYADYRNNINELDRNTIIYGHGRKDLVMFGSLIKTLNSDWYTNKDNQFIQFSTPTYDSVWQIFSIYKISKEDFYITNQFNNDDDFNDFINIMEERSIYNFNIDVGINDKIITLSTCYNDYGMRLVVQAKLINLQKK